MNAHQRRKARRATPPRLCAVHRFDASGRWVDSVTVRVSPGARPAFNLPDLRGLFPPPRRNWAGGDPTPEELAQVRAAGIPPAADLPKS